MRKLREGGERVGAQAFEVAALMSRAASLWRALGGDPVARLRGVLWPEGTRRLVADDDGALRALAVAEMAGACVDLARAVARLAAKCHDPLLRRFGPLFAALVSAGAGEGDAHGLRYAAAKKMDRKSRKIQRLVAATGLLFQELDLLAELEQAARLARRQQQFAPGEAARRAERQRREVDRLRAISLWSRTFDYAVRLLARSLFTVVARIIEVFDLQPPRSNDRSSSVAASLADRRLSFSWSNSFVGSSKSLVYPSDFGVDTPPRSSKSGNNGDVRRFLVSRSQSLRQQLKWPVVPGKHLIGIGCMVGSRGKSSPSMEKGWIHVHGGDHDLPLSFSYASSVGDDDFSEGDHVHRTAKTKKLSTSVFESSSQDVLASAPDTTLGAAALASHYASLIVFLEKLAISPQHICSDERDALYGMLTGRLRASLRSRLKPSFSAAAGKKKTKKNRGSSGDPVLAAEWADAVEGILGWLAPLAHNTVRWRSERSFEQRHVSGGGSGASVLLLQTLHFADREKTEAAITELLVGLNRLWRHGTELSAARAKLESTGGDVYHDCKDYIG